MPANLAGAETSVSATPKEPMPASGEFARDTICDRAEARENPNAAAKGIVKALLLSTVFWITLLLVVYLIP